MMYSIKKLVAKILGALLLVVLFNEILLITVDNLSIGQVEQQLEEDSQALAAELASKKPEQWLGVIQAFEQSNDFELLLNPALAGTVAPIELPAVLSPYIVTVSDALGDEFAVLPDEGDVIFDDEVAIADFQIGWGHVIAGTGWELSLNASGEPSLLLAWAVGAVSLVLFGLILYWLLRPIQKEFAVIKSSLPAGRLQGQELSAAVTQELQQLHQQIQISHDEWRDLLHGVAHELRSPLARISFALSEWQATVKADEREEFKGMVDKAIDDLDGLVGEVLRYSRLELHGGKDMLVESVELDSLLASCCERMKPIYPEIDIHIDGYSPFVVEANQEQLQRAVINLLRNAARYSERQILVDWQRSDAGCSLIIDDDGPGIPPGKRQRIFEPFTRLDPSRSRDSGGNGLGLAIVKSIVDNHGGEIKVEDSPLGGARFVLTLPE